MFCFFVIVIMLLFVVIFFLFLFIGVLAQCFVIGELNRLNRLHIVNLITTNNT